MEILKKENRTALLINIAAAVLFTFLLQPLVILLWKFLNYTGFTVIQSYLNSIYINAALGQRDWVIVLIAIGLIFWFVSDVVFDPMFASIRAFIKRLKNKSESNKITISKSKRIMNIIFSLIRKAIYLVFGFSIVLLIFADMQMNASFSQRMRIIAPYIDEETEESLFANWARMENRIDYENINKAIEEIALSNKIKLPKLLYPWF